MLADVPVKIYFLIAGFVFIAVIAFLFLNYFALKEKIKVASIVTFKRRRKLSKDRIIKWKDIKDKINSDNIEDWKRSHHYRRFNFGRYIFQNGLQNGRAGGKIKEH